DRSVRASFEKADYFSELKARYLARTLGAAFSGKILDFGCGIGLLSTFIVQHLPACDLHGFDFSAASIDRIPAATASSGQVHYSGARTAYGLRRRRSCQCYASHSDSGTADN